MLSKAWVPLLPYTFNWIATQTICTQKKDETNIKLVFVIYWVYGLQAKIQICTYIHTYSDNWVRTTIAELIKHFTCNNRFASPCYYFFFSILFFCFCALQMEKCGMFVCYRFFLLIFNLNFKWNFSDFTHFIIYS